MNDKRREQLELKAIRGSTRSALSKSGGKPYRDQVKTTSAELLGQLEESVLRDGADPEMIEAIETAREDLWRD